MGKTISQGAATTLRCVVMGEDEIVSGGYYADCNLAEDDIGSIGKQNQENQQKLWSFTELLLKRQLDNMH